MWVWAWALGQGLPQPVSGRTAVVARFAVFGRWRCRLTGSEAAHEPIEVRPRPDHDNIIPERFMVIPLADVLAAQPPSDLIHLHAHGCLCDCCFAPNAHLVRSDR